MKKVRTLAQAKDDPRVADYSDERNTGDGIWLYLKRPWFCPDTGLAVVHEMNVRDLCDSLNSCLESHEVWNQIYGKN